jgi:hypothetical protein
MCVIKRKNSRISRRIAGVLGRILKVIQPKTNTPSKAVSYLIKATKNIFEQVVCAVKPHINNMRKKHKTLDNTIKLINGYKSATNSKHMIIVILSVVLPIALVVYWTSKTAEVHPKEIPPAITLTDNRNKATIVENTIETTDKSTAEPPLQVAAVNPETTPNAFYIPIKETTGAEISESAKITKKLVSNHPSEQNIKIDGKEASSLRKFANKIPIVKNFVSDSITEKFISYAVVETAKEIIGITRSQKGLQKIVIKRDSLTAELWEAETLNPKLANWQKKADSTTLFQYQDQENKWQEYSLDSVNSVSTEQNSDFALITQSFTLAGGITGQNILKIGFDGKNYIAKWTYKLDDNNNINRLIWETTLTGENHDISITNDDKNIQSKGVIVDWNDFDGDTLQKTDGNHNRVYFYPEGKKGALEIDPTLSTTVASNTITVQNSDYDNSGSTGFKLVFDDTKGGTIDEFYHDNVGSGSTNIVSGNSTYDALFDIEYGSSYLSGDSTGSLTLIEATNNRVVLEAKGNVTSNDIATITYNIYPSGQIHFDLSLEIHDGERNSEADMFFLIQDYNGYQTTYSSVDDTNKAAALLPDADGWDAALIPYDSSIVGTADTAQSSGSDYIMVKYDSAASGYNDETTATSSWFLDLSEATYDATLLINKRSTYRNPNDLSFDIGSGWYDSDENTTSDTDEFNEEEGIYAIEADSSTTYNKASMVQFDIDGGTNTRYKPAAKIREWRSTNLPASATLEGTTLYPGTSSDDSENYNASLKPFSDSYFADELTWYSTLESESVAESPDIGDGNSNGSNNVTYTTGKYGNAAEFNGSNSYLWFPVADNVDVSGDSYGVIEFWMQPDWASSSTGTTYAISGNFLAASQDGLTILFLGTPQGGTGQLIFGALNTSSTWQSNVEIANSELSWAADEWVHIRAEWDDTLDTNEELKLYVNGVEPSHTHNSGGSLDISALTVSSNWYVGSLVTNSYPFDGIIDEFRIYTPQSGAIDTLAEGGDTDDSDEYLADITNDYTLDFVADDSDNRGEYLFLGSDDKFAGFNYHLDTQGVDSSATFTWEYWDGDEWISLTVSEEVEGSDNFTTTDGTVYWTIPTDWAKYSVNGSPDYYYIRAHLESGSFSTSPVESFIKTDILLFQYLDNIDSDNQTFMISSESIRLSEGSIQIDVPNRYRAVMETGDTDDYLLIYDRAEDDDAPDPTHEFKGPCILETNTYCLRDDDDRKTTIIESNSTRVKVRVEGKFNNEASTDYLDDDGGDDDLDIIVDYTFTTEGVFIENMTDFKDGLTLDAEGTPTEYNGYSWLQVWADVTDGAFDDTGNIIYGNGVTEGTTSTDGAEFEDSNKYVVLPGTGSDTYQDAFVGIMQAGWLDDNTAAGVDEWQWDEANSGTQDLLVAQEQNGTNATIGKRYATWFFLMLAEDDLDTEAEREAYINDYRNPDILDFATGDEWSFEDDPDLEGLWYMESDGSTGETDQSTRGNNLTVSSGDTIPADSDAREGSYSRDFSDSDTDYLYITDASQTGLDINGPFTVMAWYKQEGSIDTGNRIVSKHTTNDLAFFLTDNNTTNGTVQFGVSSSGTSWDATVTGTSGGLNDQAWHHVVGVYDGSYVRVYRDAISEGTPAAHSSGVHNSAGDFRIGAGHTYEYPTDALIDEVAVFSRALTPAEIEQIYNQGVIEHYHEAEGAYTVEASSNQVELDIDGGTNVSNTLAGAESAGDTSIVLTSSDDFPNSGTAYIEGDRFTYTGNDTDTETLSGIPSSGEDSIISHASGAVVSMSNRHKPNFKIRSYRLNDKPSSITMEGSTLTEGTDYNVDYVPISDAYFADELLWASTLEDETSSESPDVGTGQADGLVNADFATGRYGNGLRINADGEYVQFPSASNFDKAKGAFEFWFQPTWASNDNTQHMLIESYYDGDNTLQFYHITSNDLRLRWEASATVIYQNVDPDDYSWNANDWVHLRVEWDDTAAVADQFRILINGVAPTQTSDEENDDYDSADYTSGSTIRIGGNGTDEDSAGIFDEVRFYGGASVEPDDLAQGGNTADADEYLFDETNDYTLDFEADDSDNRGEYLFLGADSMFSGVNFDFETEGVDSSADLNWQYWDGDEWASLESISGFTDGTSDFTDDGVIYWSANPTNWRKYSVNGSTDLYYIRAHLESGSYTTDPEENLIQTDILVLQYLDDIDTIDQTLFMGTGHPNATWHMDEGYGSTVHDSNLYANDLTISGATWEVEHGNPKSARDKYLKFDGSNDYLYKSSDVDFDFGTDSFSISGWFRHPESISGTDTLVAKHGANGGYKIYMNSSGYICFGIDNDGTWGPDDSTCTSKISYADSQWHHFSAIKSGTDSITLYIDGGIETTQNTSLAATGELSTSTTFYVGIDSNGSSNPWDGFLDEFAVFDSALSAAQVKAAYMEARQSAVVFGESTGDFMTEGLVGYWDLDESSGNASDTSGNGTTLTNQGTSTFSAAKFGNGTELNGSSQYFDTTDNSTLSITGNLTLAAWIEPDNVTSHSDHIIGKWDDTDESYQLIKVNDEIRMYIDSSSNYETTNATNLSADTVYHVAGVYDTSSQTVKLYINGILEGSTTTGTIPSSIGDDAGEISIGAEDTGGTPANYFDGHIDEVRVYNRALSPTEITNLYNWAPGPVGYWKLDEGNGTSAYDSSDNENTGTLGSGDSAPTWATGKFGHGLEFDGSNDYVDIGTGPTDTRTVTFWTYPETTTEYFVNITSTTDYIWANAGTVTATGFSGPTIYVDGVETSTIVADKWQHVAVVTDTSENASNLDLGRTADTNYMEGKVDDVRIYNYARTANQIIEDMNGGHPIGGSPIGSPVAHWKFDEGYGSTAYDSSVNENNGTLGSGNSAPSWSLDGKFNSGLEFDGSNDYVDIGSGPSTVNTVSFWTNPTTTTEYFVDLNGSAYISSSSGILSATGFYSPSIYVNGVKTTTVISGSWQHVTITTATSLNANDLDIGRIEGTGHLEGSIDEVKIYNSALTADQIKLDYNMGAAATLGDVSDHTNEGVGGSDPVGWWKLDENQGTSNVYDSSGNNNTLTMNNFSSNSSWAPGTLGSGLDFEFSSTQYLSITDANQANLDITGDMSVAAWIKPEAWNVGPYLVAKSNMASGGFGYAFRLTSSNSYAYISSNGTSVTTATFPTIEGNPDGSLWHHVTWVVDVDTDIKMYLNGKPLGTPTSYTDGSIYNNSQNVTIGARSPSNYPFDGLIDDVRIYNYARTPAQIAYDYNRGAPVAHWKLDACSGSTAYDSSVSANDTPNGNHGTITIGGSGDNTSTGSCSSGISTEAWNNGTTGKYNSSLSFDDTDDYITAGTAPAFDLTDGLSISAWVKTDADEADNVIVSKGASYEMGINADGDVYWDGVGVTQDDASVQVTSGSWHHVVITNDDTTVTYYVDGIQTGTDSAGVDTDNSTDLYIGYDGSNYFDGQIDDVRIYNYVLAEEQIRKVYNNGAVRF